MVALAAAILPFSGAITAFGIPLTTAAGGLTLAGSLVNLGGGLLLSSAVGALTRPDAPSFNPENVQTNSKSTTAPRMGHVGIVKVGGNVVFHRATEGISYRVVVHGHGEITRVLGHYLNNEPVALNATDHVTDEQYFHERPRVKIVGRTGQVPSAHYAELENIWSEWTANHRLDGQWTSLITCESAPPEHHRGMYPSGEPALFVRAETAKLYDPRLDAAVFSENLALATAYYIASPDGLNSPRAIDWDNITEEADFADDQMPLAEGGTEARLRASATFGLNEKPQEVLQKFLRAGGGEIRLAPSGKVKLSFARPRDAEFTITYGDILEVANVDAGPDGLDRFNVLPGRFVSHDLNHTEVDAEAWRDDARIAEDGEELVGAVFEAQFSPSHRQTRAALKVEMDRANPKLRLQLRCKPGCFPATFEEVVDLNAPEVGLVGKFSVRGHNLNFDRGNLAAVDLTLHLVDDDALTLALGEQGAVQELPPADTSSGVPSIDLEEITAAGIGVKTAQNQYAAGIGVGWPAPPSDALKPVLKYAAAGTDEWRDVTVGAGVTSHLIPLLVDGDDYDLSLAWETPGGVIGPATVVAGVTARAAANKPAPPTGLAVADNGDGTATVSMTTSTSAALWQTEVYRDGALVATFYAGMVGPDTYFEFVDNCGSGSFDWTARSVNVSNLNNDNDAGPFSASIA
ncbi:hypothetical protein [Shimia sp. MIT910701]|uniref:hypothetical protein n=1 Tax=Shimia sp. MIT910701 TaxID=3096987 RepID=UPI00399AB5E7